MAAHAARNVDGSMVDNSKNGEGGCVLRHLSIETVQQGPHEARSNPRRWGIGVYLVDCEGCVRTATYR